ncbi:hypothetical protein HK096_010751, partial [Nowakowskiella sp. JEL0078]
MPSKASIPMPPRNGALKQSELAPTNNSDSAAPQLGGLFAGGIPKLKSVASRTDTDNEKIIHKTQNARNNTSPSVPPRTNGSTLKGPPPPPPRSDLAAQFPSPTPPRTSTNAPPPPTRNFQPSTSNVPLPPTRTSNAPPAPGRPTAPSRLQPPAPPARVSVTVTEPEITSFRPSLSSGTISALSRVTDTEGRFRFRTDLPPPRMYPSGESFSIVVASNVVSGSGVAKGRAPPPPPPSRKGPPPPPARASAAGGSEIVQFCISTTTKLNRELERAKRDEDYLRCADLKQLIESVESLKGQDGAEALEEMRRVQAL